MPRGRGALGLLFICLPFTCVEVSAEKPAPPVARPRAPAPPNGLPAVLQSQQCPGTMKGEGTTRSLTALCGPWQVRDPGGMTVGSNDGEQTQGRPRAKEETEVFGQVLGAVGPAGLALPVVDGHGSARQGVALGTFACPGGHRARSLKGQAQEGLV